MGGKDLSSKQDTLTVSLLTGIVIGAINILFILVFYATSIWRAVVQEGQAGLSLLVSIVIWCIGYLVVQASLTTMGGVEEVFRRKK